MKLWQYILKADDEADLADPKRGHKWLSGQPCAPTTDDPEGSRKPALPDWTAAEKGEWTRCVLALRCLVRRLTDARPRRGMPPRRDPRVISESEHRRYWNLTADGVLRDYLGRLRLSPAKTAGKTRGDVYTRDTFACLRVLPTSRPLLSEPTQRRVVPKPADEWCDIDVLWQCAFYSLVGGKFEPVCEECGVAFGPTRTGRRSHRTICAKCAQRRYNEKLTPSGLREKWKRDKRWQRKGGQP